MLKTTPDQVRLWIAQTGLKRKELSRLLRFRSDNGLRQCEEDKALLPPAKAAWLASYADLCDRQAQEKAAWMTANPPPP